ncbi:MAG: retropepsin-like domain-containing protein [Nitrospira sp.]|nr:retropepsin-like domain-containing protein [bacterium]MBL7049254.1 retropepsin-like domain-containing protein [Nitrospira sp.]
MKCPECNKDNPDLHSHCDECEALLQYRRTNDRNTRLIVFAAALIILVTVPGIIYIFRNSFFPTIPRETISATDKDSFEQWKLQQRDTLQQRLQTALNPPPDNMISQALSTVPHEEPDISPVPAEILAGWVIIKDAWGAEITKIRAGLTGGGWVALQRSRCLGGTTWIFQADSGGEARLRTGRWIPGDQVGLWHTDEALENDAPALLAAWQPEQDMSWMSLETDEHYEGIRLTQGVIAGYFIKTSMPDNIGGAGVFMQGSNIVGWSFDKHSDKAWMWAFTSGEKLQNNTNIKHFYDQTFANGREEKIARARAMHDSHNTLQQLSAFIEAFRLQPRLSPQETPPHMLPEAAVTHMRELLSDALKQGGSERVAAMFDRHMLQEIGDLKLFMLLVPAIAETRGYEAAIAEIQDIGYTIKSHIDSDLNKLQDMHLTLYKALVGELVAEQYISAGERVYEASQEYFEGDPYLHLLSVELALLHNDWQEAERLLYSRDYPSALQDRFEILAKRISEMKSRDGKIMITFNPGAARIPVTASINQAVDQNFIVDTGATLMTIPSLLAESLAMQILHDNRRISTASGTEIVREVLIESIEINGWTEYDVRAYVLDIPDRPGLGLLGLNYLKRFEMDLRPEQGVLLLSPR